MLIFPSLQAKDLNAIREEFPFAKYFANAPQVDAFSDVLTLVSNTTLNFGRLFKFFHRS